MRGLSLCAAYKSRRRRQPTTATAPAEPTANCFGKRCSDDIAAAAAAAAAAAGGVDADIHLSDGLGRQKALPSHEFIVNDIRHESRTD